MKIQLSDEAVDYRDSGTLELHLGTFGDERLTVELEKVEVQNMVDGFAQGEGYTLGDFMRSRGEDLTRLMAHFAAKGPEKAYATVESLMADMLEDVIDVWADAHLKGGDEGCDDY